MEAAELKDALQGLNLFRGFLEIAIRVIGLAKDGLDVLLGCLEALLLCPLFVSPW